MGNVERLHGFLRKLTAGQCTHIVVFGGSVTAGHNAGGANTAYPKIFLLWLNARWPCKAVGGHTVHVSAHGGYGIHNTFQNWLFNLPGVVDLMLVEGNVNDKFIPFPNPFFLQTKYRQNTQEESMMWFHEAFLRSALMLRRPGPVAVVYFSADYIGSRWASPPYGNPESALGELFLGDIEPATYFIVSMYEVPLISAVEWLLPMARKLGRNMQFNRSYPFNTASYHADKCCHPPTKGHRMLALLLAYSLSEEMKHLDEPRSYWEKDFSAADPPVLGDPIKLSPEEEIAYVLSEPGQLIDFKSGPHANEALLATNEGWEVSADNKEHDKFGLVSTTVGAYFAISLPIHPLRITDVSFIRSYANFGKASFCIDQNESKTASNFNVTTASPTCKILDGAWTQDVSVAETVPVSFQTWFADEKRKGSKFDQVYLHVTVLAPPTTDGPHKFKVLDLLCR